GLAPATRPHWKTAPGATPGRRPGTIQPPSGRYAGSPPHPWPPPPLRPPRRSRPEAVDRLLVIRSCPELRQLPSFRAKGLGHRHVQILAFALGANPQEDGAEASA